MKERQINTMMSSRASSLLRKASGGFEPSATDKSKARAAIARRVGIGLAAGAAVAAGAKSAAAAPSLAPAALAPAAVTTAVAPAAVTTIAGVGFATKFVAALAIVGTVSAGAVTVRHVTRASSVNAPTTNAPAVQQDVQPDVQQTAVPQMPVQQTAVVPTAVEAIATPTRIANLAVNKPLQKTTAPTLQTAAEVELFQRAQLALRADDATTALALLNEHAQRFPNGALSEDRDAARVLALCAAGRQEDAAIAGAAFLSAHPNSTSAARVRSACSSSGANGAAQ